MEGEGQKFGKFSNFFKDKRIRISCAIIVILLAAVIALAIYTYKKQDEYQMVSENSYNMSFYELVNCADEIETYLAKAMITSTADHEAKTLSNVWNKANLAVVYLTQIPIKTEGLSNAEKFLNQLADYSYSLAMKAVEGQDLSDQDLKNIEDLHNYSIDLKNTLNQLETEINDGTLAWKEVVTEGGFIDGDPDAEILKGNGTDLCAQGIVNGILDYLKADHTGYVATLTEEQRVQESIASKVYNLKY